MSAPALLRGLSERGIRVVVTGDRLRLRGPQDVLTAALTELVSQHKPEIVRAARRYPSCCECAAIIGPDEPEAWWGLDRVHLDCGKAAWRRSWKGARTSHAEDEAMTPLLSARAGRGGLRDDVLSIAGLPARPQG